MDAAGHPDLLEDIDFDDLTSPQLTEVQRQILEFTEARHVDFDIEKMLAEAVSKPAGGGRRSGRHRRLRSTA